MFHNDLSIEFVTKTENFIRSVFNYYNGRINIFNKAILCIDWVIKRDDVAGYSTQPNIVYIFPRTLMIISNNEDVFKFNIIMTVIHELYHTDQDVVYNHIVDPAYNISIEYPVELMSTYYIMSHIDELEKVFNLKNINMPYLKKYANSFTQGGYLYHREDYITHFTNMLRDIFPRQADNFINNKLMSIILDPESFIELRFSKYMIMLKEASEYCPLNILNRVFYEEVFQYDKRMHNMKYFKDQHDNYHTICINKVDGCNIMYNLKY